MKNHVVKIKSIKKLTHDVKQFTTEKPAGYNFKPGQATSISVNKKGWKDEDRPFTFTNLPDDDFLQFVIKVYAEHKGVTNEINKLKEGEELIIRDVFGSITYKGEGLFIAGGAGITPFISIFKHLDSKNEIGNNKLIFANKTVKDIILKDEFDNMLADSFINILSDDKTNEYANGFITEDFLKNYINNSVNYIYLCGPPGMMKAVKKELKKLGIKKKAIIEETY